jgi:hypothetical protein
MVSLEELVERLKTLENISNDQWLATLDQRKLKELEFYDIHRDKSRTEALDKDTYEKFYGNTKYYQVTGLSRAYVEKWIDTQAKDIVDPKISLSLLPFLNGVDRILTQVPFLQLMAWIFTFELIKPEK